MISKDDVFKIGKIGKTHGVKGELSFSFDDDVFDTTDAAYLILDIDGLLVPFFLEEYRFKSDTTVLVKFEGFDTQEQSRRLVGCDVYFGRRLCNDDDMNLSWAQIMGFSVINAATEERMGALQAVDDQTQNRLFQVQTDSGKVLLLPASDELIVNFSVEQKTIHMTIPDGLLSL